MRAFFVALVFGSSISSCGKQETVPPGSRPPFDDRLDFGDVGVGPTATKKLAMTNISNEAIALAGIERGAAFESERYAFHVLDLPQTIEAHATAMATVTFEG